MGEFLLHILVILNYQFIGVVAIGVIISFTDVMIVVVVVVVGGMNEAIALRLLMVFVCMLFVMVVYFAQVQRIQITLYIINKRRG